MEPGRSRDHSHDGEFERFGRGRALVVEALESDEGRARDVESAVPILASGWLARWTEVLRWIERLPEAAWDDDDDDAGRRVFLLNHKLVALGRLRCWQEVI